MSRASRSLLTLSFAVGQTPPREVRLFRAGWNSTQKGRYLFDDAAAHAVMSAFKAHAVDVMIDLEHLSLDDEAPNYDPDARGWCKLELRPDGSLWATNITWTPDGDERLRTKRQRYVSPTFAFDPTSRRITELWNVAITGQPATDDAMPLVAASRRARRGTMATASGAGGSGGMSIQQFQAVAEAMGLSPEASVEDVLATFGAIVKAVSNATSDDAGPPSSESEPPPEIAASATADDPSAPPKPGAGAPPKPGANAPPKPGEKKDMAAAMSATPKLLMRLTNTSNPIEALNVVEDWRTSHLRLEQERATLAQERATFESAERRKLAAELVTLGAEFPSTVWADDAASTLKPRWLAMPIAELRTHVAEQRTARGVKRPPSGAPGGGVRPPAGGGEGAALGLSDREIAICKESNCDPADYVRLKTARSKLTAG